MLGWWESPLVSGGILETTLELTCQARAERFSQLPGSYESEYLIPYDASTSSWHGFGPSSRCISHSSRNPGIGLYSKLRSTC